MKSLIKKIGDFFKSIWIWIALMWSKYVVHMKTWSKYVFNEFVVLMAIIFVSIAINENTGSPFWSTISYWWGTVAFFLLILFISIRTFIAIRNALRPDFYKIKKGRHFSGFRFYPVFFPKEVLFTFMFTEEAKYASNPNTQLREQWNKIGGISFGILGRKSARIAWRYNSDQNKFEIASYFHRGNRIIVPEYSIFEIGHYEEIGVRISREKEIITIQLFHGVIMFAERKYLIEGTNLSFIGYRQFPYFGGKAPAPNDITIKANFNISPLAIR